MAPTLRYVAKLSSNLINSKHLGLLQQKYILNQCKQYSSLQPQYKIRRVTNTVENNVIDNREFTNDIVTRIKVDQLEINERLCAAQAPKEDTVLSTKSSEQPSGKPSSEKLLQVHQILSESLPKLFIQPLDYTIYHDNIVFEDRIRNRRTEGLMNYVKQVALLRMIGHIKFAFVKFDILKITQHPEDGTVRVRWRIVGISAVKVMFQFWKFKMWKWKEMFEHSENWYDGYSTFYVDQDGKIVKHIADKMMPDSDSVTEMSPSDLNNAKLALMIALIPRFSEVGCSI